MQTPQKKRNVLVCLAGLSPAVVTETLYAMYCLDRTPILPDEVFILTTTDAVVKVKVDLLGRRGAIACLLREYLTDKNAQRLPRIHVELIRNVAGRGLRDIRTTVDSAVAGEFLSSFLRRLHADPAVTLHCSVAGGRKTMGVLLALALQLHGGPDDHLYHVLVNEPFDMIPQFFFPPRKPIRYRHKNRYVSSSVARIELARIPFVRLGAVTESYRSSSMRWTPYSRPQRGPAKERPARVVVV
ncbi:MAG: CRISPR-associated ring nuclease Csm6 [Vicinamibacteria bacterium]|nr:CRISPR-associated ring nuclease Csm6 [Vicinamibacteria bacterium]